MGLRPDKLSLSKMVRESLSLHTAPWVFKLYLLQSIPRDDQEIIVLGLESKTWAVARPKWIASAAGNS